MAIHIAILLKPYIRLILEGRKTMESRLTKTDRTPFGDVSPGDRIYFKASSGPFMAMAVAKSVECIGDMKPADIRGIQQRWNHRICGHDEYWQAKKNCRFATLVHLAEVEAIDVGPSMRPSRGVAWFVLEDNCDPVCDVTLSAGAVRNQCVRIAGSQKKQFPAEAFGSEGSRGEPITLIMPDGETVKSDFVKGMQLRWRGWKPYFEQCRTSAGDVVRFTRVSDRRYKVTMLPKWRVPAIDQFITPRRIKQLIQVAMTEDAGEIDRDITSDLAIPSSKRGEAVIRARRAGRLSGAAILVTIAGIYDKRISVHDVLQDGFPLAEGDVIARVAGPLRSILKFERVALNFLTHLSGIASLTAQYVNAVRGTSAGIYDTRKTTPGLRGLEKYAVRCGGGMNHRFGLYDAVLVKDNHIADVQAASLDDAVNIIIKRARQADPPPKFIEVEVDTIEQFKELLTTEVDLILLDNMTPAQLGKAVNLRDKTAPHIELEASGGVTLKTVRAVADTGVDRIAIGALTHSAPALDIGMDIA